MMLGCTDAVCLAEIGGALGVEYLVTGNVGKVGNRFLVNLQLIDIRQIKVVNRVKRESGSEGEMLAAVAACRYPPEGTRSYGPTRAAVYGGSGYAQEANAQIACIAMIETRKAPMSSWTTASAA